MAAYRVYARKIPTEGGGYTMDHTATIYMMNSKGQFVGLMSYQESEITARSKLRRLLDFGGTS
jgi:protein SCO1/2